MTVLPDQINRVSVWRKVLIRAGFFWFALLVADYLAVYFYGSWFWSNAAYLFGSDIQVTFGVLMFIEGAAILALGAIWASGSMETQFQWGNIKTNPYYHGEDWKQRKDEIQQENAVGKILMLAGGPILIASFIVLLA
jgi:hypothetical protein